MPLQGPKALSDSRCKTLWNETGDASGRGVGSFGFAQDSRWRLGRRQNASTSTARRISVAKVAVP
jgi:hypothetical protein